MLTSIVAGLFALTGVALGTLLEPLKSTFQERARGRQERAERAARVIQSATRARSLLLAINTVHRQTLAEGSSSDIDADEIVRQYRTARADLRQTVALLYLSGPDDLVDAAEAVLAADRALRGERFALGAGNAGDALPASLETAADALEAQVKTFAMTARRHVR